MQRHLAESQCLKKWKINGTFFDLQNLEKQHFFFLAFPWPDFWEYMVCTIKFSYVCLKDVQKGFASVLTNWHTKGRAIQGRDAFKRFGVVACQAHSHLFCMHVSKKKTLWINSGGSVSAQVLLRARGLLWPRYCFASHVHLVWNYLRRASWWTIILYFLSLFLTWVALALEWSCHVLLSKMVPPGIGQLMPGL